MLDLLDPVVSALLYLTGEDLFQEWLPLNLDGQLARTQVLARAVLDCARYDALLYPSARYPGGRNYAVFPDRVAPEDRAVYDPENELAVFRLPRGPRQ